MAVAKQKSSKASFLILSHSLKAYLKVSGLSFDFSVASEFVPKLLEGIFALLVEGLLMQRFTGYPF